MNNKPMSVDQMIKKLDDLCQIENIVRNLNKNTVTNWIDEQTREVIDALREIKSEPMFTIYKGEICYKSKDDDQSYGMWCPVQYQSNYGLTEGTMLYAAPPELAASNAEPVAYGIIDSTKSNKKEFLSFMQLSGKINYQHELLIPLFEHPPLLQAQPSVQKSCDCAQCIPNTLGSMRMILCSACGNKRCPHATDHRYSCTKSNDIGQFGSAYRHVENTPQPSVPSGWKLVPIEPTEKMIKAALPYHEGNDFLPYSIYTVMLYAAPKPEVKE